MADIGNADQTVNGVAVVLGLLRQADMTGDLDVLAQSIVTALGFSSPRGETDSVRNQVRDTYVRYGLTSASHHYCMCMANTDGGKKPRLREARERVKQLCEGASS